MTDESQPRSNGLHPPINNQSSTDIAAELASELWEIPRDSLPLQVQGLIHDSLGLLRAVAVGKISTASRVNANCEKILSFIESQKGNKQQQFHRLTLFCFEAMQSLSEVGITVEGHNVVKRSTNWREREP